jgi:hypothetical protein
VTFSKQWYSYMFARYDSYLIWKRVWDVNNRKWRTWCKIVSLFLCNNTYGLPMLTMDTKCTKQVFYVWLVDLHNICVKQGLETGLTPNNVISICLPDMEHRWPKNAIWEVNNMKWCKWCKVVSLFYLITLMAYVRSQRTPNFLINYSSKSSTLCVIVRSSLYLC